MIIIDVSHYEIVHEMDQEPGTIPDDASDIVMP